MARASKYTKEILEPLVRESTSIAQVIDKLGLKAAGGTYNFIGGKIKTLGIDTSHFTGMGWAKGLTKDTSDTVASITKKITIPDDEFFQRNTVRESKSLRNRLAKIRKYVCSECGISEWRGKELTLHVDHIDGDRTNNTLINLRYLCPNCHQQTDTWGR